MSDHSCPAVAPTHNDVNTDTPTRGSSRTRDLRETFRERIQSWNGKQLDRQALLEVRHRSVPVPALPGVRNHLDPPTFNPRLHTDDADFHIAHFIHEAMTSSIHKQNILALRGEPAMDTLQVMQKILDDPQTYDMVEHRHTLRRLLIRLSQSSRSLPASLFLQGVECTDREPVGGGSFADIFQATFKKRGVALKRLRVFQVSLYLKTEHNSALYREALVWRQLNHPNTLPFLGIDRSTFRPYLCMVSPWMENGNIIECMKHLLKIRADIPREPWLLEIIRGLAYLHQEKIIHGDLRGANIMIDEDLHIRLADFGLALLSDAGSSSMSSHGGGGTRWTPPEVLNGRRPNYQSDVYAFACVCIEIYTLRPPFPHLKDAQVVAHIIQGTRPERPCGEFRMQDYVWELVTRCWAKEPSLRPNADAILEYLSYDGPLNLSPNEQPKSSSFPFSPIHQQPIVEAQEIVSFTPGHSSNPSTSSSATRSTSPSSRSSPFPLLSPPLSFSSDSMFESVRSPIGDGTFNHISFPKHPGLPSAPTQSLRTGPAHFRSLSEAADYQMVSHPVQMVESLSP